MTLAQILASLPSDQRRVVEESTNDVIRAAAEQRQADLAAHAAELADMREEKTSAEAKHAELLAIAESADAVALAEKVAEQKLTDKEREILEIDKQIAELEAKRAEKRKPASEKIP